MWEGRARATASGVGEGVFFFLLSRFQVFTVDDVLSAGFGILTVSVRVSYGLYDEKKEDAIYFA